MNTIMTGLSLITVPNDSAGIPGLPVLISIVGGVKVAGYVCAVLAVVLGAVSVGLGRHATNHTAQSKGKEAILGGLGAAFLIAAVDALVTFFAAAGGTV